MTALSGDANFLKLVYAAFEQPGDRGSYLLREGKFAALRGATPSQASRLNRRTEIHLERRGLEKRVSRSRIVELAAVEVWGVSS